MHFFVYKHDINEDVEQSNMEDNDEGQGDVDGDYVECHDEGNVLVDERN